MTRSLDLTGRLLKQALEDDDGEVWEVIELPAIMPSGRPLFPEYWPLDQLLRTKNRLPVASWMAQYMQNPTADEGALIKREWWRDWPLDHPPACKFVVQARDTAYSDKETANRSAMVTWREFTDYVLVRIATCGPVGRSSPS